MTCEVSLCYGCRTRTWNVSSSSTTTVNLRRLLSQISNNCTSKKRLTLLIFFVFVLRSVLKNSPHACVCPCVSQTYSKTSLLLGRTFFNRHFHCDPSFDHIQSALWYEDSPWWLSWRLADKTMYILFYPLKFPSTPVLILFKVLQHHNNLLWPRAGLEPAFTRKHREYLRTCAYSVSNLWQFASLLFLIVG